MDRVEFRPTIEVPWTGLEPVRVGHVSRGVGTPDVFVTVERDEQPLLRVDLYEQGYHAHYAFQSAIVWCGFLVIGYGGRVHLVSLESRQAETFMLDGYFGSLFELPEHLLVADSQYLHCFDRNGSPIWRSPSLAVDGVLVHSVDGGVIHCEGQVDGWTSEEFPGRWEEFRILLASGKPAG